MRVSPGHVCSNSHVSDTLGSYDLDTRKRKSPYTSLAHAHQGPFDPVEPLHRTFGEVLYRTSKLELYNQSDSPVKRKRNWPSLVGKLLFMIYSTHSHFSYKGHTLRGKHIVHT